MNMNADEYRVTIESNISDAEGVPGEYHATTRTSNRGLSDALGLALVGHDYVATGGVEALARVVADFAESWRVSDTPEFARFDDWIDMASEIIRGIDAYRERVREADESGYAGLDKQYVHGE